MKHSIKQKLPFFCFLAVTETTSELRVAGSRKVPGHSSSTNHLTNGSTGPTFTRRSNLFTTNRIEPTTDPTYETHLPLIREPIGTVERQQQLYDDLHSHSRPKTPLASTSPKSTTRPPSASISSIFNTFSKRSTENFISSNGETDELIISPSRQSRRPSIESNKYGTVTNQIPTKQKHSVDSGVDSRYSSSPPDAYQQQRISHRFRSNLSNVQIETPLVNETITKERANAGKTIT